MTLHQRAFPNYLNDMPVSILNGLDDISYKNDMMASFIGFDKNRKQLVIWMDHKNPEMREDPEMVRFYVYGVTHNSPDMYDYDIDDNPLFECENITGLELFLSINKVIAE